MNVLSWMYFILSKCLLACVPKYTSKNFKKLIKRETSPVKWNQSKFKSAQLFYFYYFLLSKPIRAERWIWVDFHSFPKKSDISSDFISNPLRPWMPENQITRETFLSTLIFPTREPDTSQYSEVLWIVWSAHQTS